MLESLEKDITLNKISHAYFFECNNEKRALKEAEDFAKRILWDRLESNPDYVLLDTAEKAIKVDEIRELQKDILKKPIFAERKVYIINEANKLNIAAQNCLLKTLEEPPQYTVMILVASSVYSVIGTVRSRVKTIKIPDSGEISIRGEVKDIIDNLKNKNKIEVLRYAEYFEKNKDDIIEILHEMMVYCKKQIEDRKNELSGQYICDTITLAKYVPIINFAEKRITENANFSMTIDEMLLNMKG